jgi:hypothetical protein
MADTDAPEMTPIFDFMVVRPPDVVDPEVLRRDYIHDDVLVATSDVPEDLNSVESTSVVGRLIYKEVFCGSLGAGWRARDHLVKELLKLLTPRAPVCEKPDERCTAGSAVKPLLIEELERHAYVRDDCYYYLLPDRLDQVAGVPLMPQLIRALLVLDSERLKPDRQRLVRRLEALFDGRRLHAVVFNGGGHSADYVQASRALFDALYLLYVLRRWTTINLEHIIGGLRVLHVLEALAIDQVYDLARAGQLNDAGRILLMTLAGEFPALQDWDLKTPVPGFPLIGNEAALDAYRLATPIVHPLFARLFWYKKPFNDIKPIGIGDLKVVKQWLTAYLPGEICDIHNIMEGEIKERVHRRLEKTEETFAFSSSRQEETTKDTQSTARFELKQECEQIIKTDLNLNANASFQYKGDPILVTVGAGFAFNKSDTHTEKTAQNFSSEVVSKAVTRIQNQTTTQRSTTKIFETEETNKHGFAAGNEPVSGIYRWVDKRYKAQLYNYGKRMMFEFVVPEPAAFLVESRLRAFESSLDYPQPPPQPDYNKNKIKLPVTGPTKIDKAEFDKLRKKYDLSAYTFPEPAKRVEFINQEVGEAFFSEKDLNRNDLWYAKSYKCQLNATGYTMEKVRITGQVTYYEKTVGKTDYFEYNITKLSVDGTTIYYNQGGLKALAFPSDHEEPPINACRLTRDDVDLVLAFQGVDRYDLMVSADLVLEQENLLAWQTEVFNAVEAIEQKRVDEANQELTLAYNARLSEYHNRLAELKTTAINDLLQGGAEAINRELILTELKRQCLAVITKEFDVDKTDDVLTDLDSMGTRKVDYLVTRLNVDEQPEGTTVGWVTTPRTVLYPAINLNEARTKGRHIQFLEQAFEWRQLAYIFYPYFWSTPPKWVQLMARSDDADPNLTAFLQAGAAKVLVAVTPGYDEAVLHFLATREPWEGGPSPVIGDPLYIPLYEELRKQQDDLYGAVPEGKPWEFTLPTSLVYLHGSSTPLPDLASEKKPGP